MDTPESRFQDSQWKKIEKLSYSKATLARVIPPGSTLDLGCGDGLLMEELGKRGIESLGLDLSSKAVELAKERGLEARVFDLTGRLPFEDNNFNNVILLDVLEHVYRPDEVLREAARVSKQYVFVSTPNFVSLPARLQVLLGKVPENNTPRDGHIYWMTAKVVDRLTRGAGLRLDASYNNTFWQNTPVVGGLTRFLVKVWPSLFALSFVIRLRKL